MELFKVSKKHNSKTSGDAVGVFLLDIAFSQLSGDYEADVAKLKGQVEVVETAQIKNGFTVSFIPVIKKINVEQTDDFYG